jgi:hypothetical protein
MATKLLNVLQERKRSNMSANVTDTITTGVISLTALEVAPVVAEATAKAVEVPIENTITLVMQVIMSLATLYKLFFHKPKTKTDKENV